MLATIHVICSFPGCGHSSVLKKIFSWPLEATPDAEIPVGWSVVLRRGAGDDVVALAVCENHDFQFSDIKSRELRPVGFDVARAEATE